MGAKGTSRLSKYGREVLILRIAEMIHGGVARADIVEYAHTEHNYSIKTINNLIAEANHVAAKVYSEEDKLIVKNQISALYESILFDDDEAAPYKLKAAEQYSKLLQFYNPEVQINNNTLNINAGEKLSDNVLDVIEEQLKLKKSEDEQI